MLSPIPTCTRISSCTSIRYVIFTWPGPVRELLSGHCNLRTRRPSTFDLCATGCIILYHVYYTYGRRSDSKMILTSLAVVRVFFFPPSHSIPICHRRPHTHYYTYIAVGDPNVVLYIVYSRPTRELLAFRHIKVVFLVSTWRRPFEPIAFSSSCIYFFFSPFYFSSVFFSFCFRRLRDKRRLTHISRASLARVRSRRRRRDPCRMAFSLLFSLAKILESL